MMMNQNERKTFFRFVVIYLSISFVLFSVMALYYYQDQRKVIENNLAFDMSSYGSQIREYGQEEFPKGFTIKILPKKTYPYPAFLHKKNTYISTSCGGLDYPNKLIAVVAGPEVLKEKIITLKKKTVIFMVFAFIVNLFIAIFLSWLSLRPVRMANREFKEFVEDVIHDLNAPISALQINLESLESTNTGKQIHRMKRSIDTVKNLYMNLEVFLQNKYKSSISVIDLSKVVNNIIEQQQFIYPNITFVTDIKPIKIETNGIALERIIVNLVQNASKYTNNNPVIKMGMNEKNYFFIQDNGIGIEDPKVLLLRSKQANPYSKGYGLGLSIVKKMAGEYGIPFFIDSEEGKGTTFYFDLSKHIVNTK